MPTLGHAAEGCFPDNKMRLPVNLKNVGMTKDEALRTIDEFKQAIAPYAKAVFRREVQVHLQWEEERVNAVATLDDNDNPVIHVYGGLVRYSMIDRDTLLAILCHELGHPFGGAPKAPRGRSTKLSWSSAEGQADYFATMKCLPLVWNGMNRLVPADSNSTTTKELRTPKTLDDCKEVGSCQWALKAARGFAHFHASLVPGRAIPDPNRRDPVVVGATNFGHPAPQCRLDTLIAGIFCPQGPDAGKFDDQDPEVGACSEIGPHPEGARPRCWFAR